MRILGSTMPERVAYSSSSFSASSSSGLGVWDSSYLKSLRSLASLAISLESGCECEVSGRARVEGGGVNLSTGKSSFQGKALFSDLGVLKLKLLAIDKIAPRCQS